MIPVYFSPPNAPARLATQFHRADGLWLCGRTLRPVSAHGQQPAAIAFATRVFIVAGRIAATGQRLGVDTRVDTVPAGDSRPRQTGNTGGLLDQYGSVAKPVAGSDFTGTGDAFRTG